MDGPAFDQEAGLELNLRPMYKLHVLPLSAGGVSASLCSASKRNGGGRGQPMRQWDGGSAFSHDAKPLAGIFEPVHGGTAKRGEDVDLFFVVLSVGRPQMTGTSVGPHFNPIRDRVALYTKRHESNQRCWRSSQRPCHGSKSKSVLHTYTGQLALAATLVSLRTTNLSQSGDCRRTHKLNQEPISVPPAPALLQNLTTSQSHNLTTSQQLSTSSYLSAQPLLQHPSSKQPHSLRPN
ncbi:hypothetical protein K490DRAFT_53326 [Saccharata proteae CBS 121410]|uniref:Uncharacterized protein n=1 Tax=Saccharata proteae CBS 121410 TaxID=1314787 RepID=A0A9P4I2V8_9PEZI|nr:hypothetical protein K490DRAFT_53326 [Saccharata proteae CBS 121410]